jgi:hypothetical protein
MVLKVIGKYWRELLILILVIGVFVSIKVIQYNSKLNKLQIAEMERVVEELKLGAKLKYDSLTAYNEKIKYLYKDSVIIQQIKNQKLINEINRKNRLSNIRLVRTSSEQQLDSLWANHWAIQDSLPFK